MTQYQYHQTDKIHWGVMLRMTFLVWLLSTSSYVHGETAMGIEFWRGSNLKHEYTDRDIISWLTHDKQRANPTEEKSINARSCVIARMKSKIEVKESDHRLLSEPDCAFAM